MKRVHLYLVLLVLISFNSFSKHIVGGEIIYDHLGGGNYRVTLKIYRDCLSDGAPFDGANVNVPAAILTVYEGNGTLVDTFNLGSPVITNIPPTINNPCIQAPNNVCVEEGVYTYTLNLPPKTGGYYLIYQRCCRNNTILNLVTPGNQGSTYYTKIPGPEDVAINSSPRYNNFPPIFVCNNVPFTFDHSALDPDGDQLVYSLCPPFQGLDVTCPSLGGQGCPTEAPPLPYANVVYSGTYSGTYPIASNPAFSIHPTTGLLTGRPNLIGQYVVGVCVQEFRNGNLINTHYRDFQFNVTPCIVQVVSVFADQTQKCQGNTLVFENQSFGNLGGLTYLWDFGVPNISSDTSVVFNPTYTYPDTGQFVVTLIANPGKQCSDTLTKTVFVYPELKVGFNKQGPQCLSNNSFNFNNTSVHINNVVFNWDFGAEATPSNSNLKNPIGITYNKAGTYIIKMVATQYSCSDSITDTLKVFGRPNAKINNLPMALCDPARIGFINGSSSELPIGYQWRFSNGVTSTEFEPIVVFTPPGIYHATLVATTNSICLDSSIAAVNNITVYPSPRAGFSFSPNVTTIFDPEITFRNESGDDVVSWFYDYGDSFYSQYSNSTHEYSAAGSYTVMQIVGNVYNCKDTTKNIVKILPEYRFWIPNTFTPNGDGMNDVFMPKGYGLLEYEMEVYNKWGQKIFTSNEKERGWDGTFNGKPCEQDVYVWRITYQNEVSLKQEYHVGHVNLLPGEK